MKRLVILSALLLTALAAAGQWIEMPKHVWGLRGGARMNDMTLTYNGFSKYEHTMVMAPTVGLYARHRLWGLLSLRTDVVYAGRGVDLHWCDVQYSMSAPYLDIRPLVQMNLGNPWWTVLPYVNAGLECSLTLPMGKINYTSNATPATSLALNKNNIRPFDLGLWVGGGFDIHLRPFYHDVLLIIEAGADFGLLNTFANAEQTGGAQVLNPEMEDARNLGERKNRGFEAAVALCIPIVKKNATPEAKLGDDIDPELAQYVKRKRAPATVSSRSEARKATTRKHPGLEYEIKECYTLDEILRLVARGEEVCDLRICLFDINFAFDSYDLTLGSKQRLDQVVQLLQEHPELSLRVNGHTDSIGSDEYNDRLSFNRASEVAGYLIRKGVRSSRVSYAGFGEHYPIDTNGTEAGRYRNRRVELELYCDDNDDNNQ